MGTIDKNINIDSSNDTILISIIVPVYNVEDYVDDCLASLLNQGFEKLNIGYEILCIDDGSTDRSLDILNRYEKEFSVVKVIHKENGGVSSARNTGIRIAKGEFIAFVDSDDYIISNSLGPILEHMIKEGKKSCDFNFKIVEEDCHFKIDEVSLEYAKENNIYKTTPNVCGIIIPTKVVREHNIFFREDMKYGEDTLFQYYLSLFLSGKEHLTVKSGVYCYRQRQSSAMHQKNTNASIIHMNDMLCMAREYSKMCSQLKEGEFFNNTKLRQDKAVMAAMFDAARVREIDSKKFIDQLKAEHLYPIKFAWWTLKFNQPFRTFLFNLICFCFPIKFYYYLFVKIIRLK